MQIEVDYDAVPILRGIDVIANITKYDVPLMDYYVNIGCRTLTKDDVEGVVASVRLAEALS